MSPSVTPSSIPAGSRNRQLPKGAASTLVVPTDRYARWHDWVSPLRNPAGQPVADFVREHPTSSAINAGARFRCLTCDAMVRLKIRMPRLG